MAKQRSGTGLPPTGHNVWPSHGVPVCWLCQVIWLNQCKMLKKWCRRWGSNPHIDGRRVEDTEWSYLSSRTICSNVFIIKYKLYICIYVFCKIKIYNHVGSGQHYRPRLQPKHDTMFLVLAIIRSFLRPHWCNRLHGVWGSWIGRSNNDLSH